MQLHPHPLTEALLPDGTRLSLRSLGPDDLGALERFSHALSPETVYRRFLSPLPRLTPELGARLLAVDHRRTEAVAAFAGDRIVGVARYAQAGDAYELAVVVADAWQRRGVATALLGKLVELARQRGLRELSASLLAENRAAIGMLRRAFPDARFERDGHELKARMRLP